MKMLLIDDEKCVILFLASILRRKGIDCLTAETGEAGLLILAENQDIELVVTDYTMPGINGGEVLRQVKQLLPSIRVFFNTGSLEYIPAAEMSLVDKAFVKPTNVNNLLQALNSYFPQLAF